MCGHEKTIDAEFGLKAIKPPAICEGGKVPGKEQCKINSYVMNTDKSSFVDQQTMKL